MHKAASKRQPARVWDDALGVAVARLRRALKETSRGAVIILDIDRVAELRAQLGYARLYGLLQALERRLRERSRWGDIVSSLGEGRLLLVALGADSLIRAVAVAEHVLRCLEAVAAEVDGAPLLRGTVGISTFPEDGTRPLELLRKSELAVLSARQEVGRSIAIYEPALGVESLEASELAWALSGAIHRDEIAVVYQPQVHAPSGRLVGLEALARWEHPERGTISPGRFIPLAEENGLIARLTDAVLRRVCRDAAGWRALGSEELRVSVNLSGEGLNTPGRGLELLEILREGGAEPSWFEFELTESSVVRCSSEVQGSLAALCEAGASVAIDDFGTGYASLAYLSDFPAHTLKIDRRFVAELTRSAKALDMVRAIIVLGRTFGLRLIGEGAETAEQVQVLGELGVEIIQGFVYSPPQPLSALPPRFPALGAPPAEGGPGEDAPAEDAPAEDGPAEDDSAPLPESCELPMLPAVLALLADARRGAADLDGRIEALAEADPTLAAHLLARAVGVQSDSSQRVETLGVALARSGAWPLVEALRASMASQVFLPPRNIALTMWMHSIQTACWSASIASHLDDAPSEERAYLAGLLHDMGRFLLLQYRSNATANLEQRCYGSPDQLRALEASLMGADHSAYGAAAARAWGLPESLCVVLAYHHAPLLPAALNEHRLLVQIVRLGDILSIMMLRRPSLGGGASALSRAAAIQEVAARERAELICLSDTLAGMWGLVDQRSQEIAERLGLSLQG